MNTLVQLAATNAVAVLPLAVLVLLLSQFVRHAALKHTLWVLVVVKFVAPPIFSLPVTVEWPAAEATVSTDRTPTDVAPITLPAPNDAAPVATIAMSAEVVNSPNAKAADPRHTIEAMSSTTFWSAMTGRLTRGWMALGRVWQSNLWLQTMLLVVWMLGTLGWTGRQLWRAFRFERLLAAAPCVPTRLQQQTDALAADLGLKQAPRVFVIDAAVSPMLWGCGRKARLLFPADLALRLDDEARATLITHELAHYSRGDHLVRLLELVATAFFWWHPVLWWARSQIEQAEEECCDAWVVRQFPHVPRRYAEALLDTIDFLCEQRRALPPLASGLGQAPFLRRRLIQIMQGPQWKPVPARVRTAILLVAAAVLPLQPFAFATPSLATGRPDRRSLPDAEQLRVGMERLSPSDDIDTLDPAPTLTPRSPVPPVRPRPTGPRARPSREGTAWSTAVSPDGRFVVEVRTVRRLLLTDLQRNLTTDLSGENLTSVAFAPDEPWFAAAGSDGRITIWDSITGKLQRTVDTRPQALRSIAIAPDGRSLAVGGVDGIVAVYDVSTGRETLVLPRAMTAVNCVRYSPNGRLLAVATGDWMSAGRGRVAVYDAETGQSQATLTCNSAPGAVAFASDEELIVGEFEGKARLWNLATRQVVAESQADKAVVATAAFSADNPALREITFAPVEAARAEDDATAFGLLRTLLDSQR